MKTNVYMTQNLKSEKVKNVVDDFGRLSFMLETYVKLQQTGDHHMIADTILQGVKFDAAALVTSLNDLTNE